MLVIDVTLVKNSMKKTANVFFISILVNCISLVHVALPLFPQYSGHICNYACMRRMENRFPILMTNTQNNLKRHSKWMLRDLDAVFLFFPSAAVEIHICCGTITSQFRNRSHLKIPDAIWVQCFCLVASGDLFWAQMIWPCPFGSGDWEFFPLTEGLSTNGTQQEIHGYTLERQDRLSLLGLQKGIAQFYLQRT